MPEWNVVHREVTNATRTKKNPFCISIYHVSHIPIPMNFKINTCTYPSMNLNHEAISTIVVVKLYLATVAEAMVWTEKYPFLCTNYEFKRLENNKWIALGSWCFKATMDRAKSLDA
jgi:hypothetical protein